MSKPMFDIGLPWLKVSEQIVVDLVLISLPAIHYDELKRLIARGFLEESKDRLLNSLGEQHE